MSAGWSRPTCSAAATEPTKRSGTSGTAARSAVPTGIAALEHLADAAEEEACAAELAGLGGLEEAVEWEVEADGVFDVGEEGDVRRIALDGLVAADGVEDKEGDDGAPDEADDGGGAREEAGDEAEDEECGGDPDEEEDGGAGEGLLFEPPALRGRKSGVMVMAKAPGAWRRSGEAASERVAAADGLDEFDEREEHGDDGEPDDAADEEHEDGGEEGGERAEALISLVFVHAGEHAEGGGEIAGAGGEFEGGGDGGGEEVGSCGVHIAEGASGGDGVGEAGGFAGEAIGAGGFGGEVDGAWEVEAGFDAEAEGIAPAGDEVGVKDAADDGEAEADLVDEDSSLTGHAHGGDEDDKQGDGDGDDGEELRVDSSEIEEELGEGREAWCGSL